MPFLIFKECLLYFKLYYVLSLDHVISIISLYVLEEPAPTGQGRLMIYVNRRIAMTHTLSCAC